MKKNVKQIIANKTILITGGTGSFGHSVAETLLSYKPKQIIIFSRDEKKQFDMRNTFQNKVLKFFIGDVRDIDSVNHAMEGVDYVFHAAALKQVPSCEFFPTEAVKTNILGAANVLSSSIKYGVKRVVILSTDKAVYPINAMGMSKALMEKTMIAYARELNEKKYNKTTICGVRYGNVLYSRGSVIPYFIDLMKQKKPLTVTCGLMTRFLLPLRDAVDLVSFALTNGKNGHMYVRKAPACSMDILAQALVKIFHYAGGIKEVGIRAGEKLHETLLAEEERMRCRDVGLYYDIIPESQGLDYNQYYIDGNRVTKDDMKPFTSENTKQLSLEKTIQLLKTLPEIQKELRHWK